MNGSKPWEPIIISDNLSWPEFSRLNLFLHELPGTKPIVSIARNYPQKNNFSHVIGYVSDLSNKDLNEPAPKEAEPMTTTKNTKTPETFSEDDIPF